MRIAIVLGHRLNDDGSLTQVGIDRLTMLRDIDRTSRFDRIILSGGIANPAAGRSEAKAMLQWLEQHDSQLAGRSVLEQSSRSTWGNARYSAPMALEMKADEVTVITSQSHLDRRFLCPRTLFRRKFKGTGVKLSYYGGTR